MHISSRTMTSHRKCGMAGAMLIGCAAFSCLAAPSGDEPSTRAAETLVAPFPCPANGVAPPHYGVFIGNSATLLAYEFASPCIPKEVLRAAESIGMARTKPVGIRNVSTTTFVASGLIASDGKGRSRADIQADSVKFTIAYYVPGLRLEIDGMQGGNKVHEIRVVAEGSAWNEQTPGMGELPATGNVAAREAQIFLTPFGAVWALADAEGAVKVSVVNGATVLQAPSASGPIAVTLDQQERPVHVILKSAVGTYEADFGGYRGDWEPEYLVRFPEHIVWRLNSRVIADLTVKKFNANTYAVFPKPLPLAVAK